MNQPSRDERAAPNAFHMASGPCPSPPPPPPPPTPLPPLPPPTTTLTSWQPADRGCLAPSQGSPNTISDLSGCSRCLSGTFPLQSVDLAGHRCKGRSGPNPRDQTCATLVRDSLGGGGSGNAPDPFPLLTPPPPPPAPTPQSACWRWESSDAINHFDAARFRTPAAAVHTPSLQLVAAFAVSNLGDSRGCPFCFLVGPARD